MRVQQPIMHFKNAFRARVTRKVKEVSRRYKRYKCLKPAVSKATIGTLFFSEK